ncbi:MAG TPA: helix-turn-helix transcriptional regulator [Candidatus Avilachnospira avistercoris]|nr:helix-turn-helix transcriptional regulator [Candidatus Avilachnospira avistercoris]
MNLNERIFFLLDKNGQKATDLAKFIGVADSSVTAWKKEGSFPSSKYISRISEFLNVPLDYLCTGDTVCAEAAVHELSSDELELLSNYRRLDSRGKHKLHTVIYEELDRIGKMG